ncbi:MAG: response regulator [Lewinellaceae bacterium]|nr:response regulator [Lewinellaceae bacterium]
MKAIIIDTQPARLEALLLRLNVDITVFGSYADGDAGIAAIQQELPDLAFVNIDLTGIAALDTIERTDQSVIELIFISEWATFAFEAFQVGASDFLLKPLQERDVRRTLDRVAQKIHNKSLIRNAYPILKNLLPRLRNNRVAIQESDTINYIPIRQIVRCDYEKNGWRIVLKNNRSILVPLENDQLEAQLHQFPLQRVNATCVVNLIHVEQYKCREDCLILQNGVDVPVSTALRSQVLQHLSYC